MNLNFEVCIPSWNSLEYLKLAVRGIQRNSSLKHCIRVHDNGSDDGTIDWLKENNIQHTRSEKNEGFCAVNHVLRQVQSEHVMVLNTDMIPLPGWDLEIAKQINEFKRFKVNSFTISSCLIEPTGNNPEYTIENFGADASSFDEEKILKTFKTFQQRYYKQKDTIQYSHPILFPTAMLKRIGYFDTEYFPGWAADHDIAARAYYNADCRNFVMLGKSRVYHFSSKTFSKLPENIRSQHGEDLFFNKWNHSVLRFRQILGVKHPYAHPC